MLFFLAWLEIHEYVLSKFFACDILDLLLIQRLYMAKKCFSIIEAANAYVAHDLEDAFIFVSPPAVEVDTDEDLSKSDECQQIEHLGNSQKEWDALVKPNNGPRITNKQGLKEWCSYVRRPSISLPKCSNGAPQDMFPPCNYDKYRNLSAREMFELFIDDEIIALLVEQTNKYAQFKNYPDLNVSAVEMKCFLASLLNSSLRSVPDRGYDFAAAQWTLGTKRFKEILKFLHCVDNTQLDKNDKFCKIRPFADLLKRNFLKHFQPSYYVSFDDCLIGYFGKRSCYHNVSTEEQDQSSTSHSPKAFGPKLYPIAGFGYSAWCLNQEDGYLVNFEFDPIDKRSASNDQNMSNAASSLKKFAQDVSDLTDNLFVILCHNKYIGRDLLGDQNLLTIEKNMHSENSTETAKKRKISLPVQYKETKKGTVTMQKNMHKIAIRNKKWWFSIFTWLIDVAMNNAWLLVKKSGNSQKFSRQTFTQEITLSYRYLLKGDCDSSSSEDEDKQPSSKSSSQFVEWLRSSNLHR